MGMSCCAMSRPREAAQSLQLGRRVTQIENKTLTSKKAKPKDISEYINAAPKEAQKKLREMRACIRAAAPGAAESLKWGMPAFSRRQKMENVTESYV